MDNERAARLIIGTIVEAIRDAKEMPSGVLYAHLMPLGMSLDSYQAIIAGLTRSGLITSQNHLLVWVG